jgi:hypothetical protein
MLNGAGEGNRTLVSQRLRNLLFLGILSGDGYFSQKFRLPPVHLGWHTRSLVTDHGGFDRSVQSRTSLIGRGYGSMRPLSQIEGF